MRCKQAQEERLMEGDVLAVEAKRLRMTLASVADEVAGLKAERLALQARTEARKRAAQVRMCCEPFWSKQILHPRANSNLGLEMRADGVQIGINWARTQLLFEDPVEVIPQTQDVQSIYKPRE